MPALLVALALAAPSAPAPLPRPAPPPPALDFDEIAGRYSAAYCGCPFSFTLSARGGYAAFDGGKWWAGTYSVRGGAVRVEEWPAGEPGLKVTWWFRPARGPGKKLRRGGYACELGPPPGKKAD